MQGPNRSLFISAVPVLITVLIIGYLAGGSFSNSGSSHASSVPAERAYAASNPVVLEYPSQYGWKQASGAPQIAGLQLSQAFLLAPHGEAADAGLLAGQIGGRQSSPLPAQFLARVSQPLKAEVVNLPSTQAYRYSQLNPVGLGRRLTLYAIPHTVGATTAIVCYSRPSAAAANYLRTCEQIAAQLTLQVEAQSNVLLTPDAGYAHQISAIVGRVDRLRVSVRPAMRTQAPPTTLSKLSTQIASGLAAPAKSMSALQPPLAAGWAHTALTGALAQARAAYLELASAAGENNSSRYFAARTKVYEAEASIASALKDFALLGYE